MYLTGWEKPVVLRFVKFQLVGSQWRKYESSLFDKGLIELPEPYDAKFNISVVNIEENGQSVDGGSPYVVASRHCARPRQHLCHQSPAE